MRRACLLNGVSGLCLTKLDVMDSLETIRVCVAYELDGERIERPPLGADAFGRCLPVYEDMPGWRARTAGVTRLEDLPAAARDYIARLETLVETPVHLVSTGPERSENIVVEWPFGDAEAVIGS